MGRRRRHSRASGQVPPEVVRELRDRAAPGATHAEVEEALRRCFSGKRDALRTVRLLDIEVRCVRGAFVGLAVDISRSGALIRIMDPRFASEDDHVGLMAYTARCWEHFEHGLEVLFTGTAVTAQATVVRVAGHCGRGSGLIFIGCRFAEALREEECAELGIAYADDES